MLVYQRVKHGSFVNLGYTLVTRRAGRHFWAEALLTLVVTTAGRIWADQKWGIGLPGLVNTQKANMTIFSGFSHWHLWFSICYVSFYQRVNPAVDRKSKDCVSERLNPRLRLSHFRIHLRICKERSTGHPNALYVFWGKKPWLSADVSIQPTHWSSYLWLTPHVECWFIHSIHLWCMFDAQVWSLYFPNKTNPLNKQLFHHIHYIFNLYLPILSCGYNRFYVDDPFVSINMLHFYSCYNPTLYPVLFSKILYQCIYIYIDILIYISSNHIVFAGSIFAYFVMVISTNQLIQVV